MRNLIFDAPPEVEILYRDEDLVAINKPSGLLVHRSEIDKHETQFAIQVTRDQIGQRVFPVHRLDRPTSGVLLFALNSEMAREINQLFIDNKISKTYQAIVRGFAPKEMFIDYALRELPETKKEKQLDIEWPVREAQTELRCLAQSELPFASGRYDKSRYSLLELSPKTGRKHQLRRHLAHIRHPIIGDTKHGDGKQNKAAREHLQLHRLALVARTLSFEHPKTKTNITIHAGLDNALTDLYQRCGFQDFI